MKRNAFTTGFLAGITAISTLAVVPAQNTVTTKIGSLNSDFRQVGGYMRFALNSYGKKQGTKLVKRAS